MTTGQWHSLESSLEILVITHIKAAIQPSLDQYQFAYRENRSTDDTVAIVLHTLIEHLEHMSTYARLLFVDYISGFNTILPNKLRNKLHGLGLSTTLCKLHTICKASTRPPLQPSTAGPPRVVFLAHFSTHFSHTTAALPPHPPM